MLNGVEVPPHRHLDAQAVETLVGEAVREIAPDADLAAMALAFNLFRVANRIQQDLETGIHRPAGVSWAAFRILFTIRYTREITPLELARLSSVSQASISSVLNTLERYGLIVRDRSPIDGRMVIVKLTDAGEQKIAELFLRNNAREQDWSQGLTQRECETMVRLLRKLLVYRPPPLAEAPDDVSGAPPSRGARQSKRAKGRP
jgi:DNA-binding MarR family transcriptional regulator